MRKLFLIIAVSLVFLFLTSFQSFAQCCGDFNCDGDVDGSDLAIFAADFGRTDCVSNIPKVIGYVSFGDLGEVDLRSLQLAIHVDYNPPVGAPVRAKFDDIKILVPVDYRLAPNLNLMAANGERLLEVTIFFGDKPEHDSDSFEVLKLTEVLNTSIKHLPPANSGAPFLFDISLSFEQISFYWHPSGWTEENFQSLKITVRHLNPAAVETEDQ